MTVAQLGHTLNAIDRGAVLGILGAADTVLATKQLAERQSKAITTIRELHRPINLVTCAECGDTTDGCVCEDETASTTSRVVCEECGQDQDGEWTGHPCATVRAIDEAGA